MSSRIKTEHNPWKAGDEDIILELANATNTAIKKGFKPLNEKCYLSCYVVAKELKDRVEFIEGRVQVPKELKEFMPRELDNYYHWILDYKGVWWDPHCTMVFAEPSDPLPMKIIKRLSIEDFEARLQRNVKQFGFDKVWGGKVIKRQPRFGSK